MRVEGEESGVMKTEKEMQAPSTPGEAIRQGRASKSWTQAKLALEMSKISGTVLTPDVISTWENGHHQPSLRHWELLARRFGWWLPYAPVDSNGNSDTPG